MAHLRHHPFPGAGRLPPHACGAVHAAVETEELLPQEPGPGCAPELLLNTDADGE